MYLFHESPQSPKALVILGPRTIQLRSDQNTGKIRNYTDVTSLLV